MYKFNYYLVVESNNIKRVFINFFSIKLIYILLIGIIYIYTIFAKDEEFNMNYYLDVLKKYAVFSGRARRREYRMFILINAIIVAAISAIDYIAGTKGAIGTLYGFALIIPTLAVTVRRLHDIGKNGYWYFISLVPFIGSIWLLVLLCKDSEEGSNRFGENLKRNINI